MNMENPFVAPRPTSNENVQGEKKRPSPESIALEAQAFVQTMVEDQSSEEFEVTGGDAAIDLVDLYELERFANGSAEPVGTSKKYDGFSRGDFRRLIDAIHAEMRKRLKMEDWVKAAERKHEEMSHDPAAQEKHRNKIDDHVAFYRRARERGFDSYLYTGPGRDLIHFAFGKSVAGFTPEDMSPGFADITPEEFIEIFARAEMDQD